MYRGYWDEMAELMERSNLYNLILVKKKTRKCESTLAFAKPREFYTQNNTVRRVSNINETLKYAFYYEIKLFT